MWNNNRNLSLVLILGAISIDAYASTYFYTVRTNQPTSLNELKKECDANELQAQVKLRSISERIFPGQPDILTVAGFYGVNSHRTGGSRSPSTSYEYYCVLKFDSKNSSAYFSEETPALFMRLSRNNWEKACEPSFNEASTDPNSPFSMIWLGWSLFQGRWCEVSTIKVKTNSEIFQDN